MAKDSDTLTFDDILQQEYSCVPFERPKCTSIVAKAWQFQYARDAERIESENKRLADKCSVLVYQLTAASRKIYELQKQVCKKGDNEMTFTGLVRRVDDLGRVVIPRDVRRTLGIEEGTPLEICIDGDKVILQEYTESCSACGQPGGLLKFKAINLCPECQEGLKKL